MAAFLRDRLVVVWLALLAVTLLSSMIGGADGLVRSGGGVLATVTVLAIAFGKVAAVMFTYMDVRGAPLALKLLCALWLIIVLTVLVSVYLGAF
jgi:hypothetical protein